MEWLEKQRIYQECVDFLNAEADLLDHHLYKKWSDLLTDDIIYKVPMRITREKNAGSEFSHVSYHMNETRGSINMRIKRNYSQYNWAEDPVSRTRHFVSGFKMDEVDEKGEKVEMRTNLLLFRNKFDSPSSELISAERFDTLRKVDGQWKLAKRIVHLDHTTVPMNNMALFF